VLHRRGSALPSWLLKLNTGRATRQSLEQRAQKVFNELEAIYGTLSDRYGRRPFFLLGMALFLVGSASPA
jgi:MFS family permease